MSLLILPSDKTVQTTGKILKPKYTGIVFNPAGRRYPVTSENAPFRKNRYGIAYYPIDTGITSANIATLPNVPYSDFTIVAELQGLHYSNHSLILAGVAGVSGVAIDLKCTYQASGQGLLQLSVTYNGVAAYNLNQTSVRLFSGARIAIRIRSGALKAWINGIEAGNVTAGSYIPNTSAACQYGSIGGTSNGFRGGSSLVAFLRNVDDVTARQLSINPWQIFEPESVPFYFNAGSSGSTTLTQSTRFDNTSTFYAPTVTPGSVTLTANLFSNSSTIYLPTVTSGTLLQQGTRFDNTSSFYAPTVTPGSVTLTASLFTNTSTLYAPIVTNGGTLLQQTSRFDNTSAFYGPTVTPGTVTLTASLFSNTSTFYSPTVTSTGPQTLTQSSIFQNSSIFYSPTVSAGLSLTQADLDAIANAVWAKVIETFTAEEMYRVMFAALAGKRVGMGTATEYYMGVDGVTPRIEFSPIDAAGNGDPILNGDP